MAPMFLYQKWLTEQVTDFLTGAGPPTVKGRPVVLPPRGFAAALMQAYLGGISLGRIAEISGLPLETLKSWRREPGFLLLMDWSKTAFAEAFREALLLTDYPVGQCHEVAGEFFLLEDSLKVAVRTRLYRTLRELGEGLAGRWEHGLSLERPTVVRFGRLLLFFLALEHYWPSPAGARIRGKFLPLAREVVWPLLRRDAGEVDAELAAAREAHPLEELRPHLEEQLRALFARLP